MYSEPGPAFTVMTVWLNVLYLICRYAHLVSAMLLVGGILFYEMVVPQAISELTEPVQLAVFARARWVFRWVIFGTVIVMVLSGIYMTVWRMQSYVAGEFVPSSIAIFGGESIPWPLRTGWWWAAHVLTAVLSMMVAAHLMSGDRPPAHPVSWLRLDLMLLLITVFFAAVTRQVDQIHADRARLFPPSVRYVTPGIDYDPTPSATQPATAPSHR